ncbi:MazG-like nucleotide pyrophosphohydrolase [Microbacterium phage Fransoyer]|nr:MazG-like nucleotide pyrophosphohydrolase [Microbacterium phage Fransoyer]
MNIEQSMVRDFHLAFGHPVREVPTLLDLDRAKLRAKWMREEIDEMLEAVEKGDLVGFYDAIIDLKYFADGTGVEAGLDLDPGFRAVHRSNMEKLGPDGKPILNAEGKVQKPEGWIPPESVHAVLLDKQREDGEIYLLAAEAADQYIAGTEITLPPMPPARVVKVMQGVSVILQKADPETWERWVEEWSGR